MAGYSNKTWICPFFRRDEKMRIHCEGGGVDLPERATFLEYANRYCANLEGWKDCSIAAQMLRYYEQKTEE